VAAASAVTALEARHAAALEAAVAQVKTGITASVERVLNSMLASSQSNTRIAERDLLLSTQLELRQKARAFLLHFNQHYDQKWRDELAPRAEPRRRPTDDDWQSLSLVDDKEVEGQMVADRLGQQMAHACEWQLRELAGYTGTLTGLGRADEDRNPLRPALIGQALHRAIDAICAEAESRRLMAREFGNALAQLLPGVYAAIISDLQQRAIAPVRLSFRGVEGPGNHVGGVNSGYTSIHDDPGSTRAQGSDWHSSHAAAPHASGHTGLGGAASAGRATTAGGGLGGHAGRFAGAAAGQAADAQLMGLLRRLTQLASRHGDFDAAPAGAPTRPAPGSALGAWAARAGTGPAALTGAAPGISADGATLRGADGPNGPNDLTGLMAVNLIRAHREELLQASPGKLDHMVIDVVGSLFDQILSDNRVPPQMARQIARLQLPVLRVALVDASFFSSRRHPVRRFVNRIASLACAFDDFSSGPGEQFLLRVSGIVQEIVDGDFDQAELYTAKIGELEAFITQQTTEQLRDKGTATVLESKESELQTQQRYLQQLKAALAGVTMPDYLRDFLCQVWSQSLVLATRRDGPDASLPQRLRHAGRDVVMSVQPKGSPPMRKRFLMQLPALMKDLNEGLALIGWPDAAKKKFMDQLLPSHAESLKGASLTELEYNLMARQLEHIFAAPIPGQAPAQPASTGLMPLAAEPPSFEPLPRPESEQALPSAEVEQRFSPEEAAQVGLVAESAVDWDGRVDIDTSADTSGADAQSTLAAGDLGLDIDLTLTAEPAPMVSGIELMDHIRLGFAYQMLLKDEWQKVRLNYVSPGRSFFVFSRGREHQETISVTARMLARMCETGRLRAVENAYLMERATARARKQLAALRAPATRH